MKKPLKLYFRRHDCICRLPVQRNTFMNMPVYQEEGSPTAWISVDECEQRLVAHQFKDLYTHVESRSIEKLEVTNYSVLREALAAVEAISAKNNKPTQDYRDPKAAAQLGMFIGIGFLVIITIAAKMYL